MEASVNLTEKQEIVTWPETHYVFIEKVGPFDKNAPQAWQEVQTMIAPVSEHNKIVGFISLYKREAKIYRAGFSLAAAPKNLPPGLAYQKFQGGKYSKFVLTGPYSDLPAASGRVFEIVEEKKIRMRDDFCIENYVNDPRTTEEKDLVTEILIPTE
jgi:effector-binding domain-containing protein